ncbi:SURF1 family protein [Ramlibacter sp. PS4R-6]|uniref:SURF1 family protein n=1 Tax=Ramlibacter sp. PS4R-6 TaxID=3133438 RepID=UPI0030ACE409
MRPLRSWLVTAAALAGIAATFALGQWQLGRGRERDAAQAAIEARAQLPELAQASLAAPNAQELVHRRVVLRGTWDAPRTVFLDNRQMRGAPGFYVVTPLKLEGSDAAVLVQRGWAPRNFERREQLPKVDTPAGPVELRGRIAPPPARLYEFRGVETGPIRQNLDIAAFSAETGLKLAQVSVLQAAPPASEGLLRDWPRPAAGSERNYGYALQWWALCALIAILYVWFQFIAPRRQARPAR